MVIELSHIASALHAPALKVIKHGGAMHAELRDEFSYVCTHAVLSFPRLGGHST
jgi:hypothetical protein